MATNPNSKPFFLTVKGIALIVGIFIVAIGGYLGFQAIEKSKNQKPKEPVTLVKRGTLTSMVASTGRVIPNQDIEIKAKASGKVIALPFDVSDRVKKGDLLIALDPIDELPNVQQANASVSGAAHKVAQARLNYQVAQRAINTEQQRAQAAIRYAKVKAQDTQTKENRLKQLVDRQFISRDEYDTARTSSVQSYSDLNNAQVRFSELQTEKQALAVKRQDIAVAQTELQAAQVILQSANQRLKDTRLYAPIDGVVSSRAVQIGQIMSSGISNVGGGTTAMTVADLSHIFVIASVDESDIGQVREGQKAMVTADSFPAEQFTGKVIQIATKGVNTSNVVTFEVKIEILSSNKSLLKPEMTTNIEIITRQKRDVLWVPAQALSFKNGKPTVTVMTADEQSQPRVVQIGLRSNRRVEILSGLAEGESVVLHKEESNSRWRKNGQGAGGRGGPGGGMMMMGGGRLGL